MVNLPLVENLKGDHHRNINIKNILNTSNMHIIKISHYNYVSDWEDEQKKIKLVINHNEIEFCNVKEYVEKFIKKYEEDWLININYECLFCKKFSEDCQKDVFILTLKIKIFN